MSSEDFFQDVSRNNSSEDMFKDCEPAENSLATEEPGNNDEPQIVGGTKKRKRGSKSRRMGKLPKQRIINVSSPKQNSSPQQVLAKTNVMLPAKRKYTKRKNMVSLKKKRKSQTVNEQENAGTPFNPVEEILNTSVFLKECDDGDEHEEYDFIQKSPIVKSTHSQDSQIVCSQTSQCSEISMQEFTSETAAVEALAYSLHHSLKEYESQWTVDCREDMCRITLLSSDVNVAVEKAVVWSASKGAQVFINNKPLPSNTLIECVPEPDRNHLSEVSEYLQSLANLLEIVHVCEGVKSFENFWSDAEMSELGSIESSCYQGSRCFRSAQCFLVYMEKRCDHCEKIRQQFKSKHWRATHKVTKDKKKMNNRYLVRQGLLAKTKRLAVEKKAQKKRIKALRARIVKLLKTDNVIVDQHLSQDFFKIMKQNINKMTPVQKLIWNEQVKAISKQSNPRTTRWNPMMVKIALHLQSLSPAAYDYLRETGILMLPSQRRLYDFSHFTKASEGVQHAVLDLLAEKLKGIITEEHQHYVNLLFDEANVRSGLVVTKTGEVIGFASGTEVEKSIADLEAELLASEAKEEEAKKVLVYMINGITTDVLEVAAIYPTTDLSAQQLYVRSWDVVYNLEVRNIKVLSMIFDGAGCNKKFVNLHAKWDDSVEFVYATKNVACGENRPIFFIIDPPHLLKTLRNCFSNSYGHKNSRKMWKNGEIISWEAIELLHSISIKNKFKKHKLTWAHVKLTAFSRMNVLYATQTMSDSTSSSLEDFKDDERFNGLVNRELIEFLKNVNTFFDCLNGSNDPDGKRNKSNKNLLPYTNKEDVRLTNVLKGEVLKFFQDWHLDAQNRRGKYSAADREKMTISSQSFESLHITIYGFCGAINFLLDLGATSIDAKKFNQDKLEQYFGILRQLFGANNNPTVYDVLQKSIGLSVAKAAALPGKKGNTTAKRVLTIDETPLPCRKKK